MLVIQRPTVEAVDDAIGNTQRFSISPLEPGFGHTLGNSLRFVASGTVRSDGKADLAGCNPGWGCEKVIEHHLDAYGLRDTVTHKQGSYAAIIADTIARHRQGQPVFYYTWTPYWVSGVLVPNKDVTWLQVPFSALPGERKDVDTALPDGANYGFQANNQHIVANRAFAEANPAAAKLFAVMRLSNNDISAQNLRMRDGENKPADIARHVDAWIRGHQDVWNGWLDQARAAAR